MRSLLVCLACAGLARAMITESPENPYVPEKIGRVQAPGLKELSGLARSRSQAGRWWALNDGNQPPELYPLSVTGQPLGPPVKVLGARNEDWEELSADDQGNLWIVDMGNNANKRRDLTVYVVREPGPVPPPSIPVDRVIRVRYPDQDAFPPAQMNFDCEAAFVRKGSLYLLTKHRSDVGTKLYRLDDDGRKAVQVLVPLGYAPDVGMVTGAALHPDGRRLAVLTYNGVWLFEAPEGSDRFLDGPRRVLPIKLAILRQCEALDWIDDNTLILGNEQRDLLRAPLSEFREYP
jgi:hypothetical protein